MSAVNFYKIFIYIYNHFINISTKLCTNVKTVLRVTTSCFHSYSMGSMQGQMDMNSRKMRLNTQIRKIKKSISISTVPRKRNTEAGNVKYHMQWRNRNSYCITLTTTSQKNAQISAQIT